jgi:hypothetical protein
MLFDETHFSTRRSCTPGSTRLSWPAYSLSGQLRLSTSSLNDCDDAPFLLFFPSGLNKTLPPPKSSTSAITSLSETLSHGYAPSNTRVELVTSPSRPLLPAFPPFSPSLTSSISWTCLLLLIRIFYTTAAVYRLCLPFHRLPVYLHPSNNILITRLFSPISTPTLVSAQPTPATPITVPGDGSGGAVPSPATR